MKKLILISALLFSFNGWAIDIDGSMKCKVKDQALFEIEEGISSRYLGIEGKVDVGETSAFSYSLSTTYENTEYESDWVGFNFEDNFPSIYSIGLSTWPMGELRYLGESDTGYKGGDPKLIEYDRYVYQSKGYLGYGEIKIYPNKIEAYKGGSSLILSRYYKNDWNGMLVITDSNDDNHRSHIISFDCRALDDKYEEFFEALDEVVKKNLRNKKNK